jgi:hypothetical protein
LVGCWNKQTFGPWHKLTLDGLLCVQIAHGPGQVAWGPKQGALGSWQMQTLGWLGPKQVPWDPLAHLGPRIGGLMPIQNDFNPFNG